MYSDLKYRVEKAFDDGGADPNCCYPTYMYDEIMKVVDEYEQKMKGCIQWSPEDMIGAAQNLREPFVMSEDDAQSALEEMIDDHDCNNGVTWETVSYYVQQYAPEDEEETVETNTNK